MKRTGLVSGNAGFTMIEVLIALAIFSIGLLAVGALQARSLMDTGNVARKTEAWTVVEDQAAALKKLPFYQNVAAQQFPAALQDTAGGWNTANRLNGRYEVHWRVADDTTIFGTPSGALFAGVPAGNYLVCKLITVAVTLPGGNPNTDALAQVQFLKTWAATGIP